MYTIGELADELNRKEWAVEKMLKKRNYFKQNGDPRKWVIEDDLMDEDGMITENGWSSLINELGYKESNDDEDEDEDDDDDDEDDGEEYYVDDEEDDDEKYYVDDDDDDDDDDEYVDDIDGAEFIRENVFLIDDVELAICPKCHGINCENTGFDSPEGICIHCGTKFRAELHNLECDQCGCYVSEQKVIRKNDHYFCNEYHSKIYREEQDDDYDDDYDDDVPKPAGSDCNNWRWCGGVGKCKNDESYYYNQECPGDCEHFYRK